LFIVFVSRIWQSILPGGEANDAVPDFAPLSTLINTRRVPALSVTVTRFPLIVTTPMPVYTVPAQQNRYSPVVVFTSTTVAALLSSCRHRSKVVTAKLHVAVLPEVSVAVQVTVVVPVGKQLPEAGEHTTVAPGQLSVTTGIE
jgi:hypothetical protein